MFVEVTTPAPAVACVTLDRPARLNALSMAVAEALLQALDAVAADPAIGAVILTGRGRGFCAGGDVKEMHANRAKTPGRRRADLALMHEIPRLIRQMPQIVVAAVNGPAFGAGFALALSADLVIASATARFGTAFLKQGLASDFGLSYHLVRLAGPAAARRLIYLDAVLDADAALAMGLISEVVAPEALDARALALASRLAATPPDARHAVKHLLAMAETHSHDAMLAAEATRQIALITSDRHAAAVDAFLDAHGGTAAIRTENEARP